MTVQLTHTYTFEHDIGTVLRMNAPYDSGFRYIVVGHTFRRDTFGYLIEHSSTKGQLWGNGLQIFYAADYILLGFVKPEPTGDDVAS